MWNMSCLLLLPYSAIVYKFTIKEKDISEANLA